MFGSYAKGTEAKYSDLDFIIYGKVDMERLQEQVDNLAEAKNTMRHSFYNELCVVLFGE
ncbi:MAG: nucleotidyltransferase domain-containing protein [Clostridiales bacterium]|nr:nucleotidyltransferase domain-containing protein [Clostridiales bacterium]